MHSIRVKLTAITTLAILTSVLAVFLLFYSSLQTESERSSAEVLNLIGQNTQTSVEDFLNDIEQSVDLAAKVAYDSLDSVTLIENGVVGTAAGSGGQTAEQKERADAYLAAYCEDLQPTFASIASRTQGVITYYYCLSPAISENVHGFFYSRVGKTGFAEQPPLDARELDPADIAHTTWYYTPIERGRPSWVGPYTAHFLNELMTYSYLVPIYKAGELIGVLGMDVAFEALSSHVDGIRVYDTGYACLFDADGRVLVHPDYEFGSDPSILGRVDPAGIFRAEKSGDEPIRYTVNNQAREMVFTTLSNGMKLAVTVPEAEISAPWQRLARQTVEVTAVILLIFSAVVLVFVTLVTRPLQRLTAASRRLADGDYDVSLDYRSRDEVGTLTAAFSQMRDHLKFYIADLNRRINTDDLTGLPNMRSFFRKAEEERQRLLREGQMPVILYINLIGIKFYNRQYGFAEGDRLLCQVAEILRRYFGEDCLGHFGQDHFAAICDEEWLDEKMEGVFRSCAELNEGRNLPLRAGVYRYRLEEVPISAACDRAKYACDRLKNSAVSDYCVFDDRMLRVALNTRYVTRNLDKALAEGWIRVCYQPIVRTANGLVSDEEALSRWIDPEMGTISPAEFIPILENARLVYKLDLYVLDQVLAKMQKQKQAGLPVVPHSLNLSRVDFDSCDIVGEICRRVDAAGVAREKLTIEVTESAVGNDFDFMKQQIERFQALGFRVWMDDFGSGYSALDLLQDVHFDLIKFDMRFMHRFSEKDESKIILTELVKMAISLGIETVAEGVETREQADFLCEIGCTKLQGFYFSPAVSCEELCRHYHQGDALPYENLEEAPYYSEIGRINLHDLTSVAEEVSGAQGQIFDTLPMAIIETDGRTGQILRCNRSYRAFLKRFFQIDDPGSAIDLSGMRFTIGSAFAEAVSQCREQGGQVFFRETMPKGASIHSMMRYVAHNPVTGRYSCFVVVLGTAEPGESL